MAIKVIVEVEDGDVTGVQSNEAMDVMVFNRDKADPTSSDYVEDALGAPAQMAVFHVEPVTDVADLYDTYATSPDALIDCACEKEE